VSGLVEFLSGDGPELTAEHLDVFAPCCDARHKDSVDDWDWFCTRAAGHEGRHEAAGSTRVAAVWS
jgi:hypothetical protein